MFRVIALAVVLLFVGCCIGLTCMTSGCASVASTGSLYRGKVGGCDTHVGVRPAAASETEWAASVQVTTDYPGCAR